VKKKSFVVYSETLKEKEEWLKHLRKAIEDYKKGQTGPKKEEGDDSGALAPVWVPDSDAKLCRQCESKFTLTNRRHHCRHCGEVVCGGCSGTKRSLKGQGRVRICDNCAKLPSDWSSGKQEIIQTIQEESDSDESDVEVIYELEALYSFTPEASASNANKKLSFKKGDIISILLFDDSGWWLGELAGEKGWVPNNYFTVQ